MDSVYKLQKIIDRCTTASNITWALAHFEDNLRMEYTNKGDYTVAKLNKELCDMALLKLGIHEHLLGSFLDAHPFAADDKTRARTVLATHASARKFMHAYPGDPPCDLTWQTKHTPGIIAFLDLADGLIFGDRYDATLRQGLRNRKAAETVLTYQLIKEDLDEVLEQLAKDALPMPGELAAQAAGNGQSSTDQQDDAAPTVSHSAADKETLEKLTMLDPDIKDQWTDAASRLVRQFCHILLTHIPALTSRSSSRRPSWARQPGPTPPWY